MKIEDYVAVSGIPGLFRMLNNKPGGLVIEDLDTGKIKFASVRKHNFNPLASIGIYVDSDEETLNLKEVFTKMLEKLADLPLPAKKASNKELVEYLGTVLPEYDRDRVYPSDIKRLIKWFSFLNERDLLSLEDEEEVAEDGIEDAEVVEEVAEVAKKAPAKKKAAKKK